MHAVCLSAWRYTYMIVRMHARAHTYQPTDRQTESLTVRQSDRQTPPACIMRKKEINNLFHWLISLAARRQRGKSIVQHWLVRVGTLQIFVFFHSFCTCMQSVCLPEGIHTWSYVCMHAHIPTNQPTDRQKVWLSDSLTGRPHPHVLWERKK